MGHLDLVYLIIFRDVGVLSSIGHSFQIDSQRAKILDSDAAFEDQKLQLACLKSGNSKLKDEKDELKALLMKQEDFYKADLRSQKEQFMALKVETERVSCCPVFFFPIVESGFVRFARKKAP